MALRAGDRRTDWGRGVQRALAVEPCGTLDPARLAHGLAARVERAGAAIFEHSPWCGSSRESSPHPMPRCGRRHFVVATEAFTVELPGESRRYLPLASTIVSTEPLPEAVRQELGWRGGEAVGDARHLFLLRAAHHRSPPGARRSRRALSPRLGALSTRAGRCGDDAPTGADHRRGLAAGRWDADRAPLERVDRRAARLVRDLWRGCRDGHRLDRWVCRARGSRPRTCSRAPCPAAVRRAGSHRPGAVDGLPPAALGARAAAWLAAQSIVRILGRADRTEAAGGRSRAAQLVHPLYRQLIRRTLAGSSARAESHPRGSPRR